MQTKDVSYRCGDTALTGYLADGSGGRKAPGVLVCHQGGGLTEHTRERARMVAELGYVALAIDMYGEVATGREQAMALLTALTNDAPLLHARVAAGLAVLKAEANVDTARLAAIGYCFGGWTVLELARTFVDFACVVAFHPGLSGLPETDTRPVQAKVLVCAGADDPLISPQMRTRLATLLTAADADWQLNVYGGAGHSFTDRGVDAMNIPNFSYHADTDRRSWAAMRDLFDETLGAA